MLVELKIGDKIVSQTNVPVVYWNLDQLKDNLEDSLKGFILEKEGEINKFISQVQTDMKEINIQTAYELGKINGRREIINDLKKIL